jgi:phosphoglycerol transferase MdoB-like AlkP superfamily enzyme
MLMKPFMRKIGFRRALGQEDFDPALPRYSWGIDDASLYRIALDEIDRLAARGKPFLLTTFSTSTHHPFEIPAGFADYPDLSPRERAWHFADRAVSDFVAALAARGRLDDTLVLVTSDEASPWPDMQGDRPAALADYAENWGYMIALTPERHRERADAPFAQGDIPISVLDYLGFDTNGTDFMGRSFFRRYDTPRTIYAGNVYKRRTEELVTGGRLTVCGEALDACEAFDAAGGRVFGALQPLPGPAAPTRMMRAMRAYSATVPVEGPPEPALGG